MGRGRSGGMFSSKKKSFRCNDGKDAFLLKSGRPYKAVYTFTQEHIEALQHLSNEQLAAAIPSPAAQPSTPREQTPASGHRVGSTPRASQAS